MADDALSRLIKECYNADWDDSLSRDDTKRRALAALKAIETSNREGLIFLQTTIGRVNQAISEASK